ncbi:recombinase family protein [Burkholderia cenocepacia]|nr:recombinase family protein [Burkholderia cenocepacia]
MKIGYARVSTNDQSVALQMDALMAYGCGNVFTDEAFSGAKFHRPGLQAAMTTLQEGDMLVVWRLDRLGRSLSGLINLMNQLHERNIGFASINESIDTSSPTGMFVFHMMAALAEFERSLISERTRAGLEAARARGRYPGRPRSLSALEIEQAREQLRTRSVREVAASLRVSKRTLQRRLSQSRD